MMNRKLPEWLMPALLACFYFLNSFSASGQDNYIIQHYTNENGLPVNSIKGIELDKKNGFLWIGTQAGLVRFDGKNFNSFSSEKNTVAASRIIFVAKNREGTIFCEDNNAFIYRITHNKPQFATTDSKRAGPLMIGLHNSGKILSEYMAERLKTHPRSSFLPEWVLFDDDIRDSNSFTFLIFQHAYHYNASRDTLLALSGPFRQMMKLNGSTYFADDQLNISVYNDRQMRLMPVHVTGMPAWNKKGNEKPQLIWKRGMKEPILIYKRDIWKLQQAGDSLYLQPYCRECCPDDAYICNAQLWEEEGIIFLGSEENGLYVVRKPFLRTIRTDTLIKGGKAEYAQAEISPGMITTGNGFSFSASQPLVYRKGGLRFQVWDIYRDQHGDHWFHVGDTIIHRHKEDGHCTSISINSGVVKMIFAETQGRLFVITERAVAEITGERYRELYRLPYVEHTLKNSLDPDAAIEWKPGVLAIATEKLLLFDIHRNAAPDTVSIPGLTTKVRPLLKYGNYLFIGTYGQGFYVYKNGIVKKMPLDKNKYLSYTHCFMPDGNGFCWISTNHGLFKVSMSALIAAYEQNLPEIYYHYLGKEDGVFNTEFNGGCQPCALKLSSGLFSFPNMNGVVVFDPLQSNAMPPSGNIFVENIFADSAVYEPGNKGLGNLPYELKNISFKITVPQFGNPENVYFSYKLEPYNDSWVSQDILQNNIIQFGGLKPGDYKLYLRIRSGFEPDQFGMRVIEFRILKPWFQSWWFYALCLLGLIGLVWLIVKWRIARIIKRERELQILVAKQTKDIKVQSRQLEEQLRQLRDQQVRLESDNHVKARLIGIISHDMISPLKFMGFMAMRLRDLFTEAEQAYRTADMIVTVTDELASLTLSMLNWIRFHYGTYKVKPEQINMKELIDESSEIALVVAAEKGIAVYNDVPAETMVMQYRQALGVIIYNLVMNAVKYTNKGSVHISGRFSDDQFTLEILDTGIGMSEEMVEILNNPDRSIPEIAAAGETKKFQFGYHIIRDLLHLIQGSMDVESLPGEGSRITIGLPQQNERLHNSL